MFSVAVTVMNAGESSMASKYSVSSSSSLASSLSGLSLPSTKTHRFHYVQEHSSQCATDVSHDSGLETDRVKWRKVDNYIPMGINQL